jgi:predicted 2-oxoglutarate/Fe(II)-dependent dioxygenase YbiX
VKMVEDYIKSGQLTGKELSYVLKEAETYKKNAFKAGLTNVSQDKKRIDYEDETVRKSNVYFPRANQAYKTHNIIQSLIIQEYANKKLDVANVSEVQFVHYPIGGKFNWHHDVIRPVKADEKIRGLTFSMNLSDSDEYDGGNLSIKISKDKIISLGRERGSWICFPSFLLHNVDEITRGTRDAIVVWSYLTREESKLMR